MTRSVQRGDDLFRDDLDLLRLVAVGDEDDPLDAGGHVGPELLDALRHTAADGVLDGGLAPRRHVPLGLEPLAHGRLGLGARAPDVDRELVRAGQRLRITARLARERLDLLPRAAVALRRVEIREPTVALRRHTTQDRVDVAADQNRRAWALHGPWPHDRLAQVELVLLERHALLGPQPREDVEVPLEQAAALL